MVVALCLSLALPTRSVAGESTSAGSSASPAPVAPALRSAPQRYNPPTGLKTNNPLAGRARRTAINVHLRRLINSVPRGEKIRIASWNLRSRGFVRDLIRAHRRGVSVRFVVARGNARPENPNGSVNRLQRALAGSGNSGRAEPQRSRLQRCTAACRGPRGIAHTKFFLFSRVGGGARHVVVNGSANATDVAAYAQWNDVYTTKNRKDIYDVFERVHGEMMQDRNLPHPFVSTRHGDITTYFNPYRGAGDPVMQRLNATSCRHATNGAGSGGRTKIRIAMTSMHGDRGIRLARRVKDLFNRGCNVKIIYAVMGNQVLQIFRRGGRGSVPLRQIAQDPNGDGIYNRYLHMKVLTISGVHRGRRDARVTYNGSENWSPAALSSDEAGMRIYSARLLGNYNRWIEYLYSHPPYQGRLARSSAAGRSSISPSEVAPEERPPWMVEAIAEERGVDPYALIQED